MKRKDCYKILSVNSAFVSPDAKWFALRNCDFFSSLRVSSAHTSCFGLCFFHRVERIASRCVTLHRPGADVIDEPFHDGCPSFQVRGKKVCPPCGRKGARSCAFCACGVSPKACLSLARIFSQRRPERKIRIPPMEQAFCSFLPVMESLECIRCFMEEQVQSGTPLNYTKYPLLREKRGRDSGSTAIRREPF